MSDIKRNYIYKKALEFQKLGKHKEAIKKFDELLNDDFCDANILYDKAISLQILERFEEAVDNYSKSLDMESDNFAALVNKGLCFANPTMNRLEDAIMCYDEALRITPKDPGVMSLKGYALDSLGMSREAIACFDIILESNPKETKILTSKGLALMHLGKYDEATAYFDTVLDYEPDNIFVLKLKNDANSTMRREFLT